MGKLSHCYKNELNNEESLFPNRTSTHRVLLKLFKMWNPQFMNRAILLHSWQPWFESKERLQSGFVILVLSH
ncbi:hypothetical protein Dimus_026463 [Dionaea muscipula]